MQMSDAPVVPLVYRRRLVQYETFSLLRSVRDFMAENYSSRIPLDKAADLAFMSPFHFQRMFSRAFGETPHEFLTRQRLEVAQTLLRSGNMTVSEICLEVGYDSLGSFSTSFARQVGCSPTEYRRTFAIPNLWLLKVMPACFINVHGLTDLKR